MDRAMAESLAAAPAASAASGAEVEAAADVGATQVPPLGADDEEDDDEDDDEEEVDDDEEEEDEAEVAAAEVAAAAAPAEPKYPLARQRCPECSGALLVASAAVALDCDICSAPIAQRARTHV